MKSLRGEPSLLELVYFICLFGHYLQTKKKKKSDSDNWDGTSQPKHGENPSNATGWKNKTKKPPDCYQLGWLVLVLPPLQRNKMENTVNTTYLWGATNRKWTLRLNTSCFSLFKKFLKSEKMCNAWKYKLLHKWMRGFNEPNGGCVSLLMCWHVPGAAPFLEVSGMWKERTPLLWLRGFVV